MLYRIFLLGQGKATREERDDVQYGGLAPQAKWYVEGPCSIEASNEEEVFEILNINHPPCWRGRARSLSVGDIIVDETGEGEIVKGSGWGKLAPETVEDLLVKGNRTAAGESTKAERSDRSKRRILPITVKVRQSDGSYLMQRVDADVRRDKRRKKLGNR